VRERERERESVRQGIFYVLVDVLLWCCFETLFIPNYCATTLTKPVPKSFANGASEIF
jgi:hypothetical protein